VEAILRRQRLIVGGCLAAIIVLSWLYLFRSKASMPGMDMTSMPGMAMPELHWGAVTLFLLFMMWSVMMVAMMTPSAAPMILAFVGLNQRRQAACRPFAPVSIFLAGYFVVWTGYSALATLAQWGLHQAALLSPAMAATSPLLNGGLLLAAGIFQWTPLKRSCLRGCRSPLNFLMSEWREGAGGAFAMGLRHGAYCIGCCWVLMALLFVAGVMNLLWVAAIATFVLAEKVLPRGELVSHFGGIVMVAAGAAHIAHLW
jgi:predicted metal-binding membrane protein